MRTSLNRLAAGALLAGIVASATLALAQQPKQKPRPPTKPPTAKVDAGAMTPDESSSDATKEAGASTSNDPVPAPAAEIGDGGKLSPLTPTPPELPGQVADAGTPVDYDRLLADIAALRARVAAVSDNIYQSRVAVAIQVDGDHGKIARLIVSLDDGIVWTAPASFGASDSTTVYDHAVAPGRHAVTIDAERKDDRDETFRTSQRSRFTIDVPRDQKLEVQVRIGDDSTMGGDFPGDKSGKYDLRFRVKAVAKK